MSSKSRSTLLWALLIALLIFVPAYISLGNSEEIVATHNVYLPMVAGPDVWTSVDPSGQNIVFWHNHTRERETALLEIVDGFNSTNPWNITVVAKYQGGYGDIFNLMLGVMNTPDAPDLVVAYQNQMATYQTGNALVDMTPLVNSQRWGLTDFEKADFFPGIYDQDIFPTFDNQRLGFPPQRSMEILYYNKDWLTELGYSSPPTTPIQFQEVACAAVNNPFSGRIGDDSAGYMLSIDASRFASLVFAFGGNLYDMENQHYTLNSQEAINAMTFLQNLFDLGCAELVVERYEDQARFGGGEVLFTIGSSSGLPYYRNAVDWGAQFDWGVGALPYIAAGPSMNIYGSSVSIPKHTPERELAAWLFMKFYTSLDVQDDWVKASNYFPVRQSVAENLGDYFNDNPQYEVAFSFLPYGISEPATPNYEFVRDYIKQALTAIVNGADVITTLNQLNEDANSTLP